MLETISIRHIHPSDEEATEMARIQLKSFAGQNIRLLFFPKGKESEHEEFAYRKGQIFRGANDPEKNWIVAISESKSSDGTHHETIIGYCLWIMPLAPGQGTRDEEKARDRQLAMSYSPDSMDKEYNDKIVAEQEMLLKRLMGQNPGDYWNLGALCVDPKHQRKGAAAMMVRWGLERAETQGKGAVVGSTPVARHFYEAMGFRAEGELSLGHETHFGMRIPPPPTSREQALA
ncbi:acyl-CoA N-acyltransferase [Coniochaeta sp. 2T2.1]|nr:acyl-CoA N-acyltransferase [Coniochaeta sp. 2T2.1]